MKRIDNQDALTVRDEWCAEYVEARNKAERLDVENSRLWAALKEANEVLRSCHSVAERKGAETNWPPFTARIADVLKRQHQMIYPQSETVEDRTERRLQKLADMGFADAADFARNPKSE